MDQRPVKRSLVLGGHATSISLEPAFWTVLAKIAKSEGKSRAELITEIDQSRDPQATSLSGAIRLYLLERLVQMSGL